MAKNLFDYAGEVKDEKVETTSEEFIKDKVEKYSKMSQGEMLSTLLREVENAKAQGTFDYSKISSSLELIDQYLTPEQKKNLENLLGKIR